MIVTAGVGAASDGVNVCGACLVGVVLLPALSDGVLLAALRPSRALRRFRIYHNLHLVLVGRPLDVALSGGILFPLRLVKGGLVLLIGETRLKQLLGLPIILSKIAPVFTIEIASQTIGKDQ